MAYLNDYIKKNRLFSYHVLRFSLFYEINAQDLHFIAQISNGFCLFSTIKKAPAISDWSQIHGIPGGNRTHNYALGERWYIHLPTETY